jgi:hypothetical protein
VTPKPLNSSVLCLAAMENWDPEKSLREVAYAHNIWPLPESNEYTRCSFCVLPYT